MRRVRLTQLRCYSVSNGKVFNFAFVVVILSMQYA